MAERLVLIDGTGLIFRAYYALPSNLSTKSGLHTNAVFGFSTTFSKILNRKIPDYGAVVFDAPGGNFRHEKFADYKADRAERPAGDDLWEQMPWIERVVEAHNFVRLQVPGYEADDVIGTLTRQAVEAGLEVWIVSSDKDFAQLVSDKVRMVDTFRDVSYDPDLVRKKWGVLPEKFVDFLALTGDKIDNIPGVPGIGAKGAISLLEQFGTLDHLLNSLDALVGKNRRALEEHFESARLSQELARIDCFVNLPVTIADLRYSLPDLSVRNELYRELEFFSLLSDGAKTRQAQEEADTRYAVWTETTALPAVAALAVVPDGLAVSWEGNCASFLAADQLGSWKAWLEDPSVCKIVHDGHLALLALWARDVDLRGFYDLRVASFLAEPTKCIPHELSHIAKEYLHRTAMPAQPGLDYACHAADLTWQVWPLLRARLEEVGLWEQYVDRELPLVRVLAGMQRDGVLVDPEDLERLGRELRERLAELEGMVHEMAGHPFNLGSTKQLGTVLFDEMKLPVIKKTKTGYSTDAEVLERLAKKHDIARHLLEHRKIAKLINTYTDVLTAARNPHTGRIHAHYQITVSATGRLISTDPDLQRTPVRSAEGERIRRCFIAPPGCKLISADWNQIELRILAHFSRDPLLLEAFRVGRDVHKQTAMHLFEVSEVTPQQREVAKTVNFATIYGQGATALSQLLDVPRKTAQEYIEGYFRSYAGVREWLDRTIAGAHRDGYVTTLFGRRRWIPELSSRNPIDRQTGERMAANTPIQGTAADLCKLAMLNISRQLGSARMVLQIHDELVFEAPVLEVERVSALVRREMENVYPLEVPLLVNLGVGDNWGEAH